MSIKPTSVLTSLKKPRLALGLGLLLTVVLTIFTQFTTMDLIGWTSGFTHPLHGSDHLLAMLAVGIWAAQLRGSAIWLLPLTFVGVMSLGGLVGATGILLPGAEAIIFCSCLAFIGLIFKRIRFSHPINVAIVAFFAFFHGFAHGQEISTSASLISYTLGFMVATLLLHGTGIIIVRLLIAVFALFLSHAVYAQPLQTTEHTNSIKTTLVATSYTLENLDDLKTNHNSASAKDITQSVNPPPIIATDHRSNLNKAFNTALFITENALFKFSAFNYQTGIDFLTNGVGLTSPPLWLTLSKLCYFDSPVIHHFSLTFFSDRLLSSLYQHTRLQNLYLLATSFLTNGVGATSPPTFALAIFVLFLCCCFITAFYVSSALNSFRLLLAIKHLVFCNYQLQLYFLKTVSQLAYCTAEIAKQNNNQYWTVKGLSS